MPADTPVGSISVISDKKYCLHCVVSQEYCPAGEYFWRNLADHVNGVTYTIKVDKLNFENWPFEHERQHLFRKCVFLSPLANGNLPVYERYPPR